jgi:hypothetical protein
MRITRFFTREISCHQYQTTSSASAPASGGTQAREIEHAAAAILPHEMESAGARRKVLLFVPVSGATSDECGRVASRRMIAELQRPMTQRGANDSEGRSPSRGDASPAPPSASSRTCARAARRTPPRESRRQSVPCATQDGGLSHWCDTI